MKVNVIVTRKNSGRKQKNRRGELQAAFCIVQLEFGVLIRK